MDLKINGVALIGFSDAESDKAYLRSLGYSDAEITTAFDEAKSWKEAEQSPQSA